MTKHRFPMWHFSRPQTSWLAVSILASLFIVIFDNLLFWRSFYNRLTPDHFAAWGFLVTVGLALFLLLNFAFTLSAFRLTFKPFLSLILLVSASVSYFADTFGVVVDQSMIHNILETDVAEASELLTWPLLWHLTLYAVIPIALLLLTRVRYAGWKREILLRGGVMLGSVALIAGLAFANYKQITLFGRANRNLQVYINPTYPIHSLKKVIKTTYFSQAGKPLKMLAGDAKRQDLDPKEVVVLVVGETARAQSFSLNGYQRNTNPRLQSAGVIDFSNVESCATATAESLPCMFSPQVRTSYSRTEAKRSENLLDVLNRTGVKVIWRDNDSGDKGVASRVVYEDLSHQDDERLCTSENCFDEILLKGLAPLLTKTSGDQLIVLHTKGSHGPSYYKRTPPEFKPFLPECAQDNVQDCSQQEIANAYDNTIFYTDYLLAKLIEMLEKQDFATAMIYLSDHGESLGENGIYLHGLPYALAPAEQTHVPMVFWASDKFYQEKHIDHTALYNVRHDNFSHDNLFHSIIGLFDLKTKIYNPDLDLFARPRHTALNHEKISLTKAG